MSTRETEGAAGAPRSEHSAGVFAGVAGGHSEDVREVGAAAAPASRLSAAFTHGHPALVAYIMGGYPDRAGSLAALHALAEAGADVIELGIPYADPLADGPVIREAADAARAAAGGTFGLAETIELAREFIGEAGDDAPPVVLMGYLNPLMRMGLPKAAAAIRDAGVSGVIIPDLPPDMAGPWLATSAGIDTVFLAAPTSPPERLAKVGEMSRGFVYCVSTTGVTGERAELSSHLAEQASVVARYADGVVVGSAIVRRQHDVTALSDFVRELSAAVHD